MEILQAMEDDPETWPADREQPVQQTLHGPPTQSSLIQVQHRHSSLLLPLLVCSLYPHFSSFLSLLPQLPLLLLLRLLLPNLLLLLLQQTLAHRIQPKT